MLDMRPLLSFLFVLAMSTQIHSQVFPDAAELKHMSARFAPTPFVVNTDELSAGDRKALAKLIEAGRNIDRLFLEQLWQGNLALYRKLLADDSDLGKGAAAFVLDQQRAVVRSGCSPSFHARSARAKALGRELLIRKI